MKKIFAIVIMIFLMFTTIFTLTDQKLLRVQFFNATGQEISLAHENEVIALETVYFFPRGENTLSIITGEKSQEIDFQVLDRGNKVQNLYLTSKSLGECNGFAVKELPVDEIRVYSLDFIIEEDLFSVVVNEIMSSVKEEQELSVNYNSPIINLESKSVKVSMYKDNDRVFEKMMVFNEKNIPPLDFSGIVFLKNNDRVALVDDDWATYCYDEYVKNIGVEGIQYKGDFSEFEKIDIATENGQDKVFINGYLIGFGNTTVFVSGYKEYVVKVEKVNGEVEEIKIEPGKLPQNLSF